MKLTNRTWLLAKSRQWHKWGGLVAGVFILVTGATGILLNYKQPIFSALGVQQRPQRSADRGEARGEARTRVPHPKLGNLAAMPVSLERALEFAREEWGDVALEAIELRKERGEVIYRLKQEGNGELWINAVTGAKSARIENERSMNAGAGGMSARRTDWGRFLINLHTGRIGGEAGKAVMSIAALMLLFLTFSGVYMWLKPLMIRLGSRGRDPIAVDPAK